MLRSWRQALGRLRSKAGRPLIPSAGRPLAIGTLMACALIVTLLGVRYAGQSSAGRLDHAIDGRVQAMLGAHLAALNFLARLGDPFVVAQMGSVLFVVCLVARRWRGAVLAAVAPPAAGAITEFALKPLVGRTLEGALSLPSGHTTGAFALAVTLAVLLVNPERPRVHAVPRVLVAAAALAVAGAVAVSLVGIGAHYFTDTVAGAAVATAVVLAAALAVDRLCDSPRAPSGCADLAGQQSGHHEDADAGQRPGALSTARPEPAAASQARPERGDDY